jgi:putative protease
LAARRSFGYALAYGADAVYAGMPDTSLRARFNDFNFESLTEAVLYTRNLKKHIYIAVNLFAHEKDFPAVERAARGLSEVSPHAFIVSDPGVLKTVQRAAPDIPVHLSTQANTTNSESVLFWEDLGVQRIILARELLF